MIYKSILLAAAALMMPGCDGLAASGLAEAAGLGFRTPSPDALRAAVQDPADRRLYEARQFQPLWTGAQMEALRAAIADAPRHGLVAADFADFDALPADPAARELALTRAARGYARALANGKVDPKSLTDIYTLPRPSVDVDAGLRDAAAAGGLGDWFAGLAPQSDAYRRLSDAYLRYRDKAAAEPEASVAGGKTLKPGDGDPRVPAIAEALRAKGLLGGQGAGANDRYDQRIAAAVRQLQQANGLEVDGLFGPNTRAALNAGAADRARQIAVNMERLRWLARSEPATRIDVNTAAARLTYWRDGQKIDERRVAVGQQGWETPRLGSPMFRLVANPTWTVPKSIEEQELAPKGADYLRRNNMERRDGWIVQQPGPDNALGQVKFDMKNDHAIYLHDTPAKSVFQRADRHVSHGCVRVAEALAFARKIAEDQGKLAAFEEALATGEETFVPLAREVPVRLLYLTAMPSADGKIAFYDDAYGWDDKLANKLGLTGRDRWLKRDKVEDTGP